MLLDELDCHRSHPAVLAIMDLIADARQQSLNEACRHAGSSQDVLASQCLRDAAAFDFVGSTIESNLGFRAAEREAAAERLGLEREDKVQDPRLSAGRVDYTE